MIRYLAAICLSILCGCPAAPSQIEGIWRVQVANPTLMPQPSRLCFQPLSQPASRNREEWKDLEDYDLSKVKSGDTVKRVLSLKKDGYGEEFNLDYFSLTFRAPAGKKVEDVFAEMRRDFSIYAAWDNGKNAFRGYAKEQRKVDDKTRLQNEQLWARPDHTGAVMTFLLQGITLAQSDRDSRLAFIRIHGDVLSVCASPTDFLFATVETDQTHPVSGLRGFGLKDEKNGNWTFYSKAADRITASKTNILLWVITPLNTFTEGRKFWAGFYSKMQSRLKEKGYVVPDAVVENCNLAKWNGTSMRACESIAK